MLSIFTKNFAVNETTIKRKNPEIVRAVLSSFTILPKVTNDEAECSTWRVNELKLKSMA